MSAGLAFELAAPARIVFGAGRVREVGGVAAALGGHALLVTGRRSTPGARSPSRSRRRACAGTVFSGRRRADGRHGARGHGRGARGRLRSGDRLRRRQRARRGARRSRRWLANGGDPLDYLEVVGRGQPLTRPSLPLIAIPTTAGTGSEVTKNAVLASPEHGVKASLRSPLMLPRVAIVDPDLLAGLPPAVLAASGLDALSQLIEPFLSIRANPLTDALAREGIRALGAGAAARATPPPAPAGRSTPAIVRRSRSPASFGGLCLANAGLGAVHGFAAPLGGMFAAPARRRLRGAAAGRAARERARSRRPRAGSTARARFRELAADADRDATDAIDRRRHRLGRGAVPNARGARALAATA